MGALRLGQDGAGQERGADRAQRLRVHADAGARAEREDSPARAAAQADRERQRGAGEPGRTVVLGAAAGTAAPAEDDALRREAEERADGTARAGARRDELGGVPLGEHRQGAPELLRTEQLQVGRIDAAPAAPPPHVRGALGDEVLGGRRRRRVRCVPVPAARRRVPVPRARRRVLVLFAR
ncbi:hypothetical protein [Streptomyces sp. SA3_actF]|uniref:hypothetical protein n=1 Tax=Streptomyces sp. SA3_actF TaxID=682181 RepID=UPI001F21A400|nr:hypothetical protein [Streptomyces sp. SA3_actF]